jgi:hypothetical protein
VTAANAETGVTVVEGRPLTRAERRQVALGAAWEVVEHVRNGVRTSVALKRAGLTWGAMSGVMRAEGGEELREAYAAARQDSAELWADRALSAATRAREPREVPAARLHFDALRWRAQVSDPARYGNGGQVNAQPTVQVAVVFRTANASPTADDAQAVDDAHV